MNVQIIANPDRELYSKYFRDESKLETSKIDYLFLPNNRDELVESIKYCYEKGLEITISGGKTGVTAGSVPLNGGAVISVHNLNKIDNFDSAHKTIAVECGVTLNALNQLLSEKSEGLIFPVDPTESWASIGGLVANNASGSRSYLYGSMRDWVRSIEVILPNGEVVNIRRGESFVRNNKVEIKGNSSQFLIDVLSINKPDAKNSIGYVYSEGSDLIDLFIGSEGTLGVVTSITLGLVSAPSYQVLIVQFLNSDQQVIEFVNRLKSQSEYTIQALEYADECSLRIVKNSAIALDNKLIQNLNESHKGCVYLEYVGTEEDFADFYQFLEDVCEDIKVDINHSFVGMDDSEIRDIKAFRHAIPETVNSIIAKRAQEFPGLHKLSTDMSLPFDQLGWSLDYYREFLNNNNFEFVMFGHIGQAHLHINLMPRDLSELSKAKQLYLEMAREVVAKGGAVSAEHGIGRIKKAFLEVQYKKEEIDQMKKIKLTLDPKNLLNKGVLFDI